MQDQAVVRSVRRAIGMFVLLLLVGLMGSGGTAVPEAAFDVKDRWVIVTWSDEAARDRALLRFDPGGRSLESIPAVILPEAEARRIAQASPDALRVWPIPEMEPLLGTAKVASRVAEVVMDESTMTGPDGTVIDGAGVGIAVIDVGIDSAHASLFEATRANFRVVAAPTALSEPGQAGIFVPVQNSNNRYYTDHGTHVASIALGRDTPSGDAGVAPGASLYGFGVNTCVKSPHPCLPNGAAMLLSMGWVIQDHATTTPPIRVISISMGTVAPFDGSSPVALMTQAAVDRGLVVVWAAANAGGNGTYDATSAQAKHPAAGVLSVANYDDRDDGGRDHGLAGGSSRGAMDDPSTWPDLAAPGTGILAANGASFPGFPGTMSYGTQTLSGTSMAAPHVAGIVALMFQANPALAPGDVERILEATAHPFGTGYDVDPAHPGHLGSFDKGHGLVDAYAAVAQALAESAS